MKTLKAILAMTIISPLLCTRAFAVDKSIYGRDDRIELFDASPETRRLADSVVSLWQSADVREDRLAGTFSLNTRKLADDPEFCVNERFREQSIGSFCSGSLVGDDLVLTAGHCITGQTMCDNAKIVFGFAIKTYGASTPAEIEAKDVYSCKKVLITRSDTVPPRPDPFKKYSGPDYALIRLDRKVAGRKPLAINRGRSPKKGDKLMVIGHPLGLPLKIAAGAAVRDASPADYFVANLDSLRGNSGSPVFNAATGLIEGVLVRGDTDFDVAPAGGCYTMAVFPQNGGRGEDVNRVSVLESFIPELTTENKSMEMSFRDMKADIKVPAAKDGLSRYFKAGFQ